MSEPSRAVSPPELTKLSVAEPAFPRRLAAAEKVPTSIYVRGALRELPLACAIVGARAATGRDTERAARLAAELSWEGAAIVSGGALGVDAAAHRGALDADGHTVAVLGTGLGHLYPVTNRPLFGDIVRSGGALISQFPVDAPPRRPHFVQRNRTIAALADIVIVVGSALGSGALYTADAAKSLGRVVGAVPGSPGCDALIAQGAAVIETADDVLMAIDGRPRRPSVDLPPIGTEVGRVLGALDPFSPLHADELATRIGIAPSAVTVALTGLELEGLAVLVPGRCYVRSRLASELLAR